MTDWTGGTLANVTLRRKNGPLDAVTYLAFYDGYNGQWVSATQGRLHPDSSLHDVEVEPIHVPDEAEKIVPRGALVIEDWSPGTEHLKALLELLRKHFWFGLADQIEEQTKPPRIPEPGLWGVVEAGEPGNRLHWIKTPGRWNVVVGSRSAYWNELVDPELVREGV